MRRFGTALSTVVCGLILAGLVTGCAQGGAGGVDSGSVIIRVDGGVSDSGARDAAVRDGGTLRMDSAVRVDAGTDPRPDAAAFGDAEGVNVDGGGPGSDSGAPMIDAGGPMIDAGPMCSGSPCRLAPPQCGCGAGQSCSRDTGSTVYCRANGAGTDGATCANDTDCAAGFECVGGQCHRFCTTHSECMGPGAECVLSLADGSSPVPGSSHCSISCEAAFNVGCPSGRACRVLGGTVDYSDCGPAGSLPPYSPCTDISQCGPETTCINLGGGDIYCLFYCRNHGECPGAELCRTLGISIDGVAYGFCL